jgi:hypothetical protein
MNEPMEEVAYHTRQEAPQLPPAPAPEVRMPKWRHDELLQMETLLKNVKEDLERLQKDLAEKSASPVKKPRPETLEGKTFKLRTNGGNLFLTINSIHAAPFEVFVRVGKAGDDVMCLCEAIGRQVSLALRYGISPEEIAEELRGIGGALDPIEPSIPDAIGRALTDGGRD